MVGSNQHQIAKRKITIHNLFQTTTLTLSVINRSFCTCGTRCLIVKYLTFNILRSQNRLNKDSSIFNKTAIGSYKVFFDKISLVVFSKFLAKFL